MNFDILMKVQEQKEKLADTWKAIKDIEMELEFLYSREPDEVVYISSLEKKLDKLYEEIDQISDEKN